MFNSVLPETGFVRISEVLKVFPVSKSTWWAGVKAVSYTHLTLPTTPYV